MSNKKYVENLRHLIYDACCKKGITRDEMAVSNGFTTRNFQRIDKEKQNKFVNSLEYINQIANMLGINIVDFVIIITGFYENEKMENTSILLHKIKNMTEDKILKLIKYIDTME